MTVQSITNKKSFVARRATILDAKVAAEGEYARTAFLAEGGDQPAKEQLVALRAELDSYEQNLKDIDAAERGAAEAARLEAARDLAKERQQAVEVATKALGRCQQAATAMQTAIEALGAACREYNAAGQMARSTLWPWVNRSRFSSVYLHVSSLPLETEMAKNGLHSYLSIVPIGLNTTPDLVAITRKRTETVMRLLDESQAPEAA